MTCNHFGCSEINELYNTVVVEQNVYNALEKSCVLLSPYALTFGLDVAVYNARIVKICKTFQHLQSIHLNHRLVFNPPMLQ